MIHRLSSSDIELVWRVIGVTINKPLPSVSRAKKRRALALLPCAEFFITLTIAAGAYVHEHYHQGMIDRSAFVHHLVAAVRPLLPAGSLPVIDPQIFAAFTRIAETVIDHLSLPAANRVSIMPRPSIH